MPGKKGNKGGGGGGKKPDQPKATESAPESAFKFNFGGGNDQGEARIPTFDFGSKDSPLIPMMQKKLNSLIGKGSGYFESLPAPVQERIKGLKGLHRKKAELDRQYKKELLELQAKFDKLIDPLYARRKEIVIGGSEPSKEELEEAAKLEAEKAANEEKTEEKEEEKKGGEVKTEKQEEEEPADVKGIPNFWLNAFQHHGDFAESITKQDEKALKYLLDVRWKSLPEEKGRSEASFVLEFEFSENPYFTDKVLTKTYYLTEHELLGETMFDKMEGSTINWKPGKDLTVKLVQVQQNAGRRGGRRGRGKKEAKEVAKPSLWKNLPTLSSISSNLTLRPPSWFQMMKRMWIFKIFMKLIMRWELQLKNKSSPVQYCGLLEKLRTLGEMNLMEKVKMKMESTIQQRTLILMLLKEDKNLNVLNNKIT